LATIEKYLLLDTLNQLKMKKIIPLLFVAIIGFTLKTAAQKAINSIHFYDIKNEAMEKNYIASLKEINAIMAEMGFPKNYYSYMKVNAADTSTTYRSCTIGHWTSEQDYKTIHDHPKFKAWAEKNKDNNAVFISGQLYRRFYTIE
jgi:hypothetical protein